MPSLSHFRNDCNFNVRNSSYRPGSFEAIEEHCRVREEEEQARKRDRDMDFIVDRMTEQHREMVLRALESYESYVASKDKGMTATKDRKVNHQHTTKDKTKFERLNFLKGKPVGYQDSNDASTEGKVHDKNSTRVPKISSKAERGLVNTFANTSAISNFGQATEQIPVQQPRPQPSKKHFAKSFGWGIGIEARSPLHLSPFEFYLLNKKSFVLKKEPPKRLQTVPRFSSAIDNSSKATGDLYLNCNRDGRNRHDVPQAINATVGNGVRVRREHHAGTRGSSM